MTQATSSAIEATRGVALPASVTVGEGLGGRPVVDVASALCTGRVYLDGATVTSWVPAGGRDVLFLADVGPFAEGTPIRGGAPLCAPWFGPGRDGDKEPLHGFVRLAPWALSFAGEDEGVVTLTFDLPADAVPQEYAGTSFRFTVVFGSELTMTLGITAGDSPLELEAAIHTYFSVGDIAGVSVEGLDGVTYFDKVASAPATQSGAVTFGGQVDRVYDSTEPVRILDSAGDRTLDVSTQGATKTVVWNPWAEKGDSLADLGKDKWRDFVCVEAAIALDGVVTVEPGANHDLAQRVALG